MKFILYALITLLFPVFVSAQNSASSANSSRQAIENFTDDWANLRHYQTENERLTVPKSSDRRVVFLRSSIFEHWTKHMPEFFSNRNYINRGIAGQISSQLLIRFQQDVINLKPKAVIILAGSNDIAGSTGHVGTESIMNNIKSMAQLANANGVKVIICAYLPVYDYPWKKGLKPADKIIDLNRAIKLFALKNKHTILDYFTPFADERNGQKADLTLDGVHPNVAGYCIMAKITEEAIAKALR